ncbi:DNA polymerase nu [Frankliniella fusca]|uniref:DNA polymerase nu n=1 Tax=Frankliniella fusca TaxID=407009 RepID=A0AAE1LRZ7_9NEOP|nr:DNA polymerase nu [Frankliniella fusca]
MDLIWIRPVCKPVHPCEVVDLSSSAIKLLRALELKYGGGNILPQRCSYAREVPTGRSTNFNFIPSHIQHGSSSQTVNQPTVQALFRNSFGSQPVHQIWDVNQMAPAHQEKESSWDELSDIFEDRSDVSWRQHRRASFTSGVSPKGGAHFLPNSGSNSPIFDASLNNERGGLFQTKSWPEPELERNHIIKLTNEIGNGILNGDRTSDFQTFPGNHSIHDAEEKIDDDGNISLYESIDSQSVGTDISISPISVRTAQQWKREEFPANRFLSPGFDFQSCERLENGAEGTDNLESQPTVVTNFLESSPLFDESLGVDEFPSVPLPSVSNNDVFSSMFSKNNSISDLFRESNTGEEQSNNIAVDRLEVLDHSTEGLSITPDKKAKKKFLGTPFNRAIRSSCLSKLGNPEEDQCNFSQNPNLAATEEKESTLTLVTKPVSNDMTDKVQNVEKLATSGEQPEQNQTNNLGTKMVNENVPAAPSQYFPVFNFSNQTKRKCDMQEEKSGRRLEGSSCRKKLKFMVPYKKQTNNGQQESTGSISTAKSIQELAMKLSRQGNDKSEFEDLTEILANNICKKIDKTLLQESAMTLSYKEGFCQLNRSKDCKISHPEKILLRLVSVSDVQYISLGLHKTSWSSAFLKKLLSDKSRKICFEAQEMIQLLVDKFDFLATEVASQWIFLDPRVGCWLLNSDEPPHSFKDVLTLFNLQEEGMGAEKLLSKLSQSAQVLYENLTKFGLWKLFLHLEMRVTPILASMELHGIKVDEKQLRNMSSDRLENIQKAAYKAAGKQFQLTSPQQLSAILYDDLKLHIKYNISVKETDKQHKSTSEAMLNKFKDLHPLPAIILEFRGLHKLKSTYVDSVLTHLSGDSIYTTWDQVSAATGRITSNEPNLQAIPKQPLMPDLHLRRAFVARDGYSFLAADFQHIELRVFAHLSKDAALISALSQKTDVFKILSKEWLQIDDVENVSAEDRDKTKRIVYALMYGAGASKLVEFLHVDYTYACKILNKFSEAFPKMKDFTKRTLDLCRKQGYLATVTGRRRSFPQIKSDNFHLRTHSERQAVNFLIQGMAADLCKCAMVHTQRHLASISKVNQHKTTRLLLQIHDELLWEVPDSELLDVTDVLQEAMEGATSAVHSLSSFSVPLPVVMKTGKTWGDLNVVKTALLGPSQQP